MNLKAASAIGSPDLAIPIPASDGFTEPSVRLNSFTYKSNVDLIEIWIHFEGSLMRRGITVNQFRETIAHQIGLPCDVRRQDNGINFDKPCRNFIVAMANPSLPALQALQDAVSSAFGWGAILRLEKLVVAVRGRSKRKFKKSENATHVFRLWEQYFLPPGPLDQLTVRVNQDGINRKINPADDCPLSMPPCWARTFESCGGDIRHTLRLLEGDEQVIELVAELSSQSIEADLDLIELDDLLTRGLPSLKRFFCFRLNRTQLRSSSLSRNWESMKAFKAFLQKQTGSQPLCIWQVAMSEARRSRKLRRRIKADQFSHKELDTKFGDALQMINWKPANKLVEA